MNSRTLSRKASITTDMFNYSYRLDTETKLRLFAERGFRFIHWCDDWNNGVFYSKEDIELYRQMIESCGLKCLDVHGCETIGVGMGPRSGPAFKEYVRLLENRVEFCSAMGGDAVVVHPPKDASDLSLSLEVFELVRPICDDLGVAIAVENCFPGDEKLLAQCFEKFPPEFVCFCLDSGHANLNGNLDELMKFRSRLKVLHLHDNKGKTDDHQPPFYGTVDWSRVMRWIGQSRYSKPLNFEITHRSKYFEGRAEEYLDYAVKSILKILSLGT